MRALVFTFAFACGGCLFWGRPPDPPPPAPKAPPATWQQLRAEARAALKANDTATYRANLLALYDLSHSSALIYPIAQIEAKTGHVESALARLDEMAAAGLAQDVEKDSAFAKLVGDPRFTAIAARLRANASPIHRADAAIPLPHEDLITEDVAYDARTRTFYVSSVRKRKIVAIDADGHARDFFTSEGSIGGLALHDDRLWATTSELPPMEGYAPNAPHRTAVLAIQLATRDVITRVDLAEPGDHALTDLAAAPNGDVIASDAKSGDVFVLRVGRTRLDRLVPAGTFVAPQTPTFAHDRILLPDYARGIASIDRATSAVTWLEHPPQIATHGIDGLYLSGTTLYAIQNGTQPVRVVRFTLDAALTRVLSYDVLERASPGLGEPTHGTFANGAFWFLANAGWPRFDDDGSLKKDAEPDAPALWRLPL